MFETCSFKQSTLQGHCFSVQYSSDELKRAKYVAKIICLQCVSAAGLSVWTWKCCFGLIGILSFVVEVKQPIKGGKEDKITSRKEERRSICGKDREDKKRTTKTAGKEKEVSAGIPAENLITGFWWQCGAFWGCISWVWADFQSTKRGADCWVHLAAIWKVFWSVTLFFLLCHWIGISKQQKVKSKRWEKAEIFHFITEGERGSTTCGSCSYRPHWTSSGPGGPYFVWDVPGKALHWSESGQSFYLCFACAEA